MTQQNNYLTGRFHLEMHGETKAVFTELSGLQVETEVFEYREGGRKSSASAAGAVSRRQYHAQARDGRRRQRVFSLVYGYCTGED